MDRSELLDDRYIPHLPPVVRDALERSDGSDLDALESQFETAFDNSMSVDDSVEDIASAYLRSKVDMDRYLSESIESMNVFLLEFHQSIAEHIVSETVLYEQVLSKYAGSDFQSFIDTEVREFNDKCSLLQLGSIVPEKSVDSDKPLLAHLVGSTQSINSELLYQDWGDIVDGDKLHTTWIENCRELFPLFEYFAEKFLLAIGEINSSMSYTGLRHTISEGVFESTVFNQMAEMRINDCWYDTLFRNTLMHGGDDAYYFLDGEEVILSTQTSVESCTVSELETAIENVRLLTILLQILLGSVSFRFFRDE